MDKGKNVLIISGGDVSLTLLSSLIQKERYFMTIVADGGLVAADKLKIRPDIILGDFDTVDHRLLEKYESLSVPIISYPPEKDKTDSQIAIELAIRLPIFF